MLVGVRPWRQLQPHPLRAPLRAPRPLPHVARLLGFADRAACELWLADAGAALARDGASGARTLDTRASAQLLGKPEAGPPPPPP